MEYKTVEEAKNLNGLRLAAGAHGWCSRPLERGGQGPVPNQGH